MRQQDLKQFEDIIDTLMRVSHINSSDDEKFLESISKYAYLTHNIKKFALKLDDQNKKTQKELIGAKTIFDSIKEAGWSNAHKKALKQVIKKLNKTLFLEGFITHQKSFFSEKSRFMLFLDFKKKLQSFGCDPEVLEEVNKRLLLFGRLQGYDVLINSSLFLSEIEADLSVSKSLFKDKFRRRVIIGDKVVDILVFLSSDVNKKQAKTIIDQRYLWIEDSLKKSVSSETEPVELVFNKRRLYIDKKSINKILRILLEYILDGVEYTIKNHPELLLCNRTSIQVKILGDQDSFYFNSFSRIDSYFLGVGLSSLVACFLIFEFFDSTVSQSLWEYLMYSLDSIGSKPAENDIILKLGQNVEVNRGFSRDMSVEMAISHELQHGRDIYFSDITLKSYPILRNMLLESGFFKDPSSEHAIGFTDNLCALALFYWGCRKETVTLLEELIISIKKNVFKPILFTGVKSSIYSMNAILLLLSDRTKSASFDANRIQNLNYSVATIILNTLILYECRSKNADVIILDQENKGLLLKKFPHLETFMPRALKKPVPKDSLDWSFIDAVKRRSMYEVDSILAKNKIKKCSIKDVPKYAVDDKYVYLFMISDPVSLLSNLDKKIRKLDENRFRKPISNKHLETTFFSYYIHAAHSLGFKEYVFSYSMLNELATAMSLSYAATLAKNGYKFNQK